MLPALSRNRAHLGFEVRFTNQNHKNQKVKCRLSGMAPARRCARLYVPLMISLAVTAFVFGISRGVTMQCCENTAGSPVQHAFVPGFGWVEESAAMIACAGVAALVSLVLTIPLCCGTSLRGALVAAGLALAVSAASSRAAQPSVHRLVEAAAGSAARELYAEYIDPGYDVLALEKMLAACDYYGGSASEVVSPGSHPLLSSEQTARALAQIASLKEHWIHRVNSAGPLPIFTLGLASYLEGPGPGDPATNALLDREFGWLYEIVKAKLSDLLGAKVGMKYEDKRPGFHLYLTSTVWSLPVMNVHSDIQYASMRKVKKNYLKLGEVSVLSFTLPLQLPRSAAGLYTYHSADYVANNTREKPTTRTKYPWGYRDFHQYRVGELVVHGGILVHQIANNVMLLPGEARISLQGHGIYDSKRDMWMLYW